MENLLHIKSINIFGFEIAIYGIIVAVGMLAGVLVATRICKRRGFTSDDIIVLALYCLPLAVIGARLYYVLFSEHQYTFLEILRVWEGGLAIYGGVIGGAVGVILFCLIHKKNFLAIADVAAVCLILGQAIGRIACYFGDCCYGIEITNPNLMWFPLGTQIAGVWHYSTFFYESFCNLIIFIVLLFLYLKKVKRKGIIMALYFIMYGAIRCIIETFRGDSLYLWGAKVSQMLSLLLMVAGIVLIIVINTRKNNSKAAKVENSEISKNN